MLELTQHMVNKSELMSPYSKLDEITVTINKDLINRDIIKFERESSETKNKFNKANLKNIVAYLKKLLKITDEDGTLQLCWNMDKDGIPYTYPIKLIKNDIYCLNTCNYIEVKENEKLVEIDLTDLADIISFEMMFKDLGETHDSIEKLLKNCGIIGFEKSNILTDYFKENNDKMYQLSKSMYIENTPYKSMENKMVQDYFETKEFKTESYNEVVEYSCKYACMLIAGNILKNSVQNGITINMLAVNDTSIIFTVDSTVELNIKDTLLGDIAVRSFGRTFSIEPKISMF